MTTLDQFDQKNTTPTKINTPYLQKLRKTKWKDRKTRSLCLSIGELTLYLVLIEIKHLHVFQIEHYLLTQFLSACSAVNNDREEITMDDVVMPYKTYFKLLKTDLPSLMEEQGVDE